MDEVDYIVVGAGSAGCVLAHDLARGGRNRVLVLEAGPTDRHPVVRVPLGYGLLFHDTRRNWRFHTAPEPGLDGRRLYCPRGRTVGGSGSINAMVHCRGMPSDYAGWAARGLPGWDWDAVRPVFESLESHDPGAPGIAVTDPVGLRHPFTRHFVSAARELGLPSGADFNGPEPEGLGFYRITTRNGLRHSPADAFLRPALAAGGVRLLTGARAGAIVLEAGRAVGVTWTRGGVPGRARARAAVVLAAGAIGSPLLLQLSGIGDGAALAALGIAVQRHNPNVGRYLQDHLAVGYHYRAGEPTLNAQLHSRAGQAWQALRFLLRRRGPLAGSVNQYGGFLRSAPGLAAPDQQLYLNPATYTLARARGGLVVEPDPFPGYTLSFQPTRPESRGSVGLTAPDPDAPPLIRLDALAGAADRAAVVAGARLVARLARTAALRAVTAGAVSPCPAQMDDEAILADFRRRAGTVYHPCGSCAMGADPASSVVGPGLAVHGVGGLFVADASVFPAIPSGNINAPTLMVGRMGARAILAATGG